MMPWARDEATRKQIAANRGQLFRIIRGQDDPQLLDDLRSFLPQLPVEWNAVEVYAPWPHKEADTPIRHVWVLGETGELFIELTIPEDEGPRAEFSWFRVQGDPDGIAGVIAAQRLLDIVTRAILRQRAAGRQVH